MKNIIPYLIKYKKAIKSNKYYNVSEFIVFMLNYQVKIEIIEECSSINIKLL